MGRTPCCEKNTGLKKGPWTPDEDQKLIEYINRHGHGSWRALPKRAGLLRCGKSCRLRWTNYLRPDIKRGKFSHEEECTIIELHAVLGNKWSTIAGHLPGRTDNEIKNYWNTHLKKRLMQMGIDPVTHRPRADLLGLSNVPSLINGSAVGQLQQWENARFAATAEYLRQAMSLGDKGISSADLLIRLNDQYNLQKGADTCLPWTHQQTEMALNLKGLPQNFEHLLHSQPNECASNIKSLEQLLMQSQHLGFCPSNNISPSEYNNGCNVAGFASPCSTLSSMGGLHMKAEQQPQILRNETQFLHGQGELLRSPIGVDIDGGNIDYFNVTNHKPKVSLDQENLNAGPGYNNNSNRSCNPTTALWLDQEPLQLVAPIFSSASNTAIYNEPELISFMNASTSSSMVNNNFYGGEHGPASEAHEVGDTDGGKEYWSTMLKAVGTIPASHIITAQQ
uniref:Uncharacterized protein n=1 Tax=Araucaria cunninghamii TaxID=56994 RepID=A0A0D6R3K8_ARACU